MLVGDRDLMEETSNGPQPKKLRAETVGQAEGAGDCHAKPTAPAVEKDPSDSVTVKQDMTIDDSAQSVVPPNTTSQQAYDTVAQPTVGLRIEAKWDIVNDDTGEITPTWFPGTMMLLSV